MGDMKEIYNAMRQDRQRRHWNNYEKNLEIINGMNFELKDTVCLFREPGKPKVDFYPHTGKWKANNRMFHGGGRSFVNWYNKQ